MPTPPTDPFERVLMSINGLLESDDIEAHDLLAMSPQLLEDQVVHIRNTTSPRIVEATMRGGQLYGSTTGAQPMVTLTLDETTWSRLANRPGLALIEPEVLDTHAKLRA